MHPHPGKTSMSESFLTKVLRKVRLAVRVLEHPELSTLAKVVFAELLLKFHNNADDCCNPSAATIGKRIRKAERTVRVAIAELEQAAVLRSQQQRRGGPEYSFPGLDDDGEQEVQDRQSPAALEIQDRQIPAARPAENGRQDRQEPADKPIKRTNKENHPSLRSGGNQRSKRVRISESWQPSLGSREFALSRGLSTSEINDQVILFRNHWLDKAGKTAKKLEWDRPFQDWIIRGERWVDRSGRARSTDRAVVDWDLHIARYRASGAWMPTLGPAPDHAGCKAPLDVLYRHDFGRSAGVA
jgi:hypothetical protein